MPLIPYVVEKSGREERAMDIYSRLLRDRIVFLGATINDEVANSVLAQMLFLQSEDAKADIHLYINSPGGSVTPAWQFTIPCSSLPATWPPTASDSAPRWAPSCCVRVRPASGGRCPTRGS